MTEIFPYFSLVKKSLDQCKIAKHWFWRAFKIQDTTKQGMVWLKWIIPKIAGVHDLLAERLTRQHTDGTWPGPKIRHEIQAVQETQHPTTFSHSVRPIQFTNSVYFSFPRWISFAQALSLETITIKDKAISNNITRRMNPLTQKTTNIEKQKHHDAVNDRKESNVRGF